MCIYIYTHLGKLQRPHCYPSLAYNEAQKELQQERQRRCEVEKELGDYKDDREKKDRAAAEEECGGFQFLR